MPVNLYYTQKVRGFQQENVKYSQNSVKIQLQRTKHQCPSCGSTAVTVEPPATEYIISSFPLLSDTPSSFFKLRPTLQILIVPFFRSMT